MKKFILIAAILLAFNSSSFSQMYDLTWTNALFWNIKPSNSEATNTANAYTAIRWLITKGGGTLYFPFSDSAYLVRIVIPAVTSDSICSIRILGATPVERRFGTVNVSNAMPQKGIILKSAATSGAAVISVSASSSVTVRLENLDIRTYDQPQISGVDLLNANRMDIFNCDIETGVFNPKALFPSTLTYGLITPAIGNGASNIIRNTTITGYYVGIDANEHTSGSDVDIYSCVEGIRVEASLHAINFTKLGMGRCTYGVYGIGAGNINIDQWNIEHSSASCDNANTAWQRTVADVKDSANLLSGNLVWWTVACNSGTNHLFTVSGGSNITTTESGKAWNSTQNTSDIYYNLGKVGVGTSTTPTGVVDIVGTNNNYILQLKTTTDTSGFFLGSGFSAYGTVSNDDLQLFTHGTNYVGLSRLGGLSVGTGSSYANSSTTAQGNLIVQNKIGVGNPSPTYPLDVTGATNNYVLRVSDGTRSVGFYLESSGIPAGFGTISNSDMGFFTNGGTFNQLALRTSGNVTIGGTSDASNGKLQLTGNLNLETAGNKILIATGTNASIGTSTLSGGTVTVSTTAVTASSKIFVTHAGSSVTNAGTLYIGTITAGTSFVITSTNASDNDTVNWWIIN